MPESFILYKPKDIVSGDFYWIAEVDGSMEIGERRTGDTSRLPTPDSRLILIAVADCTGHGVPGAFMSLMGNNFLNDIIKVKGKHTPSEILDELNIQILNTLKQNSKETSVKYGMDIALISLEFGVVSSKSVSTLNTSNDKPPTTNSKLQTRDSQLLTKLQFAGAHSPLFIFRGDECIPLKGDPRSIGSYQKNEKKGFSNHNVQLMKGDMLYMFSDGFADQIGGPENKKMFSQPFKNILQSICQLEMSEQKKTLDSTITDWKGKADQTDDILVVGFRI